MPKAGPVQVVGKRRLNKVVGGNPRTGQAFETVRSPDGLLGHRYGDGRIVWMTEAMSNKQRYNEALRRAKKSTPKPA